MKLIRTIIVDDRNEDIETTQTLINVHCPQIDLVATASSSAEAIQQIQQLQPCLLLLDIEMPETDGFSILEAFPEASFKVIFITAFDEYAIRAIKYSALDYLLKPVDANELKDAIGKVEETLGHEDFRLRNLKQEIVSGFTLERIVVPTPKGYSVIPISSIVTLKALAGGYVIICIDDGRKMSATHSLSYYEDLLPNEQFVRVHKSHIINLCHVESFEKGDSGLIEMTNGAEVPLAVRRRPIFMKMLRQEVLS